MTTKLSGKEQMARAVIAGVLAVLFAGSALTTVATATGLANPAAGLYLAAGIAVALCLLAARSKGGAALAAALLAGVAAVYALTHVAALQAVRGLFASLGGEAAEGEQAALGGGALLTVGAFVFGALFFELLNRREFVPMGIVILLAVLVACHAMSAEASLWAAAPGLAAAAAAFALTGGVVREPAALRTLAPAAAAVALALLLLPAGRVTWPPLEEAANRVRAVVEQYFHFTQQRVAFSINEQGYDHAGEVGDSVVSMLGGPATPHTDPVMAVRTQAQALLRGAIRTAYTGYSWVDAAPKNRYLYIDLTHRFIRDKVFSPGPALDKDALAESELSVEMLDEGTSTLFVPGLLEDFEMDLSNAVYYNTAGEMFLSRTVRPGDAYRARALLPTLGEGLRQAALRGEALEDDDYAANLSLYTQLPGGIEEGVYTLTMGIVQGLESPYDRAVAILEYLRRNIRYTLDTEYPPRGRDFVSWFLLDSRQGYCSYYATAMAVMGRMAGLPTRYVEGYRARAGESVLTGEDAHAWAEVYFRGVGWVPFDATGGATGSGGQAPEGDAAQGDPGGPEQRDGGGDGSGNAEPEPTPTPTPAPDMGLTAPGEDAPTPTPEPAKLPGADEGAGETPDAPDEGADAPRDGATPAGERGPGPWPALAVLLLAALLALAVLWARRRLRETDVARLCAQARNNRQAALILYRACLTLLAHMGQTPVNGEAPEAFARRVTETLGNPGFVDFARTVELLSYGRRPPRQEELKAGLAAYEGFHSAMRLRERLRFAATRIFRGLGSFEAIP